MAFYWPRIASPYRTALVDRFLQNTQRYKVESVLKGMKTAQPLLFAQTPDKWLDFVVLCQKSNCFAKLVHYTRQTQSLAVPMAIVHCSAMHGGEESHILAMAGVEDDVTIVCENSRCIKPHMRASLVSGINEDAWCYVGHFTLDVSSGR